MSFLNPSSAPTYAPPPHSYLAHFFHIFNLCFSYLLTFLKYLYRFIRLIIVSIVELPVYPRFAVLFSVFGVLGWVFCGAGIKEYLGGLVDGRSFLGVEVWVVNGTGGGGGSGTETVSLWPVPNVGVGVPDLTTSSSRTISSSSEIEIEEEARGFSEGFWDPTELYTLTGNGGMTPVEVLTLGREVEMVVTTVVKTVLVTVSVTTSESSSSDASVSGKGVSAGIASSSPESVFAAMNSTTPSRSLVNSTIIPLTSSIPSFLGSDTLSSIALDSTTEGITPSKESAKKALVTGVLVSTWVTAYQGEVVTYAVVDALATCAVEVAGSVATDVPNLREEGFVHEEL